MKTKPHFNPSKVLLDTNFLLLPFQRRIDVFTEIPRLLGGHVVFLVLPQIMAELKWLTSEGSTKEQTIARNAMKLITQCCEVVEDLSSEIQQLDADAALLRYAQESGAIVATNDGELRRSLVKQGSRAIFLRKLAILTITG